MPKKSYSGINIQWPISQLILEGKKIIETRTYALPEKYLNQELLIIETPGKKGKFKSRIVGKIIFSHSFRYNDRREFYNDYCKHMVDEKSDWAWTDKMKWGWEISLVTRFSKPKPLTKRSGIVFTNNILI